MTQHPGTSHRDRPRATDGFGLDRCSHMASRASRDGRPPRHRRLPTTMKQRITYVVQNPEDFTPEQLEVGKDDRGPLFALKGVQAAKEHRITLGLNELPEEVMCESSESVKMMREGKHVLTSESSSANSSRNGMKCIYAGNLPNRTLQHCHSHHVSRPVCMRFLRHLKIRRRICSALRCIP